MQTISINNVFSAAGNAANTVTKPVRQIWLAYIGAASLTRKQASRVFGRLIEEGAEFESESKKLYKRTRNKTEKQLSNVAERVSDTVKGARSVVERKLEIEPSIYHLVPHNEDWAVRREGFDADMSVHTTKQSALEAARGIAQAHEPSRLVVHRANGTIQTSYDYGDQQ